MEAVTHRPSCNEWPTESAAKDMVSTPRSMHGMSSFAWEIIMPGLYYGTYYADFGQRVKDDTLVEVHKKSI